LAKRRASCKTLTRRFDKAEKILLKAEDRAEKREESIRFEARGNPNKRELATIKRMNTRVKTLTKKRNKALNDQADC